MKERCILLPVDTTIIKAIQTMATPFFDKFFVAVSDFGATGLVVLLCLLCYFCFDKDLGRRLSFAGLFSHALNGLLKDALRFHRPIGAEGIRTVGADDLRVDYSPDGYAYSYSMPSGHSQTSATTWGVLTFYYKRFSVAITGILITLIVGFSRIYLGVHYPSDVLAGIILGFLVAGLSALATHYLWDVKIFYAAACLLIVGSFYFSAPSDDTIKSAAALCGLTVGCYIDDLFVNYRHSSRPGQNYMILAGAVALMAGLYFILKRFLPAAPVYDFIRYFALLFVTTGPYPGLVMFLRYRDVE